MQKALRQVALDIAAEAIAAVDPYAAVRNSLARDGSNLRVAGAEYDLAEFDRIIAVGAGKASAPMAIALEEILGDRLAVGLVVVKQGHQEPTRRIEILEAAHPEPDERGREGARRILELVSGAGPKTLVVTLISGGGSALLPLYPDDVTLDEMRRATGLLLRSGATINEMNAVRKHLSLIHGGRLAQAAGGAAILALLVSDVIDNPLDVIASGPACPDPTTFADSLSVLGKYSLTDAIPKSALARLRRGAAGELRETPKPGDPIFARVHHAIVADIESAAEAAAAAAERQGFATQLVSTRVQGEAREVARVLAGIGKDMALRNRPFPPPACLVFGGETTVTVRGSGLGGRCQEMALAAAIAFQGVSDIALLCMGTDGSDGPTDAAGALVDGTTCSRGLRLGMDARSHLADNNSYPFLKATGDLIITGPTRTNVNDLMLIFSTRTSR